MTSPPFEGLILGGLHTAYSYPTGLLLTLIGMEYQTSNINPFKEHSAIVTLFLIDVFVYAIGLILISRVVQGSNYSYPWIGVCHVSGVIACELLLLILVPPMLLVIINVSSVIVIVASFLCYQYGSSAIQYLKDKLVIISNTHNNNNNNTPRQEEEAANENEMVDVEAAPGQEMKEPIELDIL